MATELRPGDLAIGIDFGGSGIKGAVVDVRTGQFVGDRIRVPTPQPSIPREVVAVMDGLVRRLLEALTGGEKAPLSAADAGVLPVGVGIPGATRAGTVLTAANIDSAWIGFPAEREMALAMGRPWRSATTPTWPGWPSCASALVAGSAAPSIVLTIGTGMGSAVFADGRLLPNTELGHLELKGRDAEERVAESARDRLNLGWKDWASGFDDYLHMLERLFWPDLFILGGGASKRADNYLQYLTVKTPVVVATLKNNAGIVGGALIAHEKRSREAVSRAGEPIA